LSGFNTFPKDKIQVLRVKSPKPAVLNLWWSADVCLAVREQRLFFIFKGYKHTTRPIEAIFHLNFKWWSATERRNL